MEGTSNSEYAMQEEKSISTSEEINAMYVELLLLSKMVSQNSADIESRKNAQLNFKQRNDAETAGFLSRVVRHVQCRRFLTY